MTTFDVRMGTHAQLLGELHGAIVLLQGTPSVRIPTQAFKSRTTITSPINSSVSPSGAMVLRRC
jgi:hypothetical protein